jgi:hypothetical protein
MTLFIDADHLSDALHFAYEIGATAFVDSDCVIFIL